MVTIWEEQLLNIKTFDHFKEVNNTYLTLINRHTKFLINTVIFTLYLYWYRVFYSDY